MTAVRNSPQIIFSCHPKGSNWAPASKLTVLRCVCVIAMCLTKHLRTIYMLCLHKYALKRVYCMCVDACVLALASSLCVYITLCFFLQHHTYSADSRWVKGLADRPLSALCLLLCIHQSRDRELWICLLHSDLLKWYTPTVCSWHTFYTAF